MSYIFIDESGDLGFNFKKKKTSKYFIVTFILLKDKGVLDKMIKKVFKSFSKTEIKKHSGTLHAHKENHKTRTKLLTVLCGNKNINIITICLNKDKVHTRLQDEKHILYNYVTNILLDRICTKKLIPTSEKIKIIASRRETSKFLNLNFSSYLKNQSKNNHGLNIEIDILSPHTEKGLRVVDMVSWSIFRKYEHGDDSYYKIIKQNIIEENPLF